MKKGRFLWSAHRITEKQKAGKARNIKGKRQLKNFNTVLRQLEEHRSFPRDSQLFTNRKETENPQTDFVCGLFYGMNCDILILNLKNGGIKKCRRFHCFTEYG